VVAVRQKLQIPRPKLNLNGGIPHSLRIRATFVRKSVAEPLRWPIE